MYFVYILECSDNTLYIGSTNNVVKRVLAHNTLKTAAKYTRSRRPVFLKHTESFETKSEALKREQTLKKLSRTEKLNLIKYQDHLEKKNTKK